MGELEVSVLMASKPPRKTLGIELTDNAARVLDQLVERVGNKKKLVSQIVEWCAAQPPEVRASILAWEPESDYPPGE